MIPKKILVASDGSPHAATALETALILAERFSASLSLLHVVNVRLLEGPFLSDLSGMVGAGPYLNFQQQVREILTRKGEVLLAALKDECLRRGVPAETELAEGVVSRVICRAARSHDLICLGRHGEHAAFRGLLLGSTVEEVVRGSSRPVLVSGDEPRPARRLLLPYDGSQTASAALALGLEMAAQLGASLTVLFVTETPEEGAPLLDEARKYAASRGVEVSFRTLTGDPVENIVAAAGRDFDLIVMGAYGHSRIRELFLGSTTAGVLARVALPVLLYR
jgi:nucleotide-binding universal stress UspA family protein